MPTHQIGNGINTGWVDKRRTALPDSNTHTTRGVALFTANATGTTTTIVGADGVPATADTNVVRRGEKFRLFTSAGVLKEEKVFTIDSLSSAAGATTITFSPAAASAPASGDVARSVSFQDYSSQANMDTRLLALSYTQVQLESMTENDKAFAIRTLDDPGGLNA